MRIFITTVAGMSTRFSRGLSAPTLKCIYHSGDPQNTLLARMLWLARAYDRLVVVGGFQFDALKAYCEAWIPAEIRKKTVLVNNAFYAQYGSGWSLYEGLCAIRNAKPDEILFAEGDLFVDQESFNHVSNQPGDVITANNEMIDSRKSVALYFDKENKPHYIYDVSHGAFSIQEPFLTILNSAQIWKFASPERLFRKMDSLTPEDQQQTNLSLINAYFSSLSYECCRVQFIKKWINCNTIEDFKTISFEKWGCQDGDEC